MLYESCSMLEQAAPGTAASSDAGWEACWMVPDNIKCVQFSVLQPTPGWCPQRRTLWVDAGICLHLSCPMAATSCAMDCHGHIAQWMIVATLL